MEDLTAIEPIGRVFNLRADKKFVGADGNVLLAVDPGPVQVVGTYTGEEKFAIYLLRNERYVKLVESSPAAGGVGIQRPLFATFGAKAGDYVYLYLRGDLPADYENQSGSLTVIPLGS